MSFTNRFAPEQNNVDNIFLKLSELKKRTGVSDANLRKIECEITTEGVNAWTLIYKMWNAYKSLEGEIGKPVENVEDMELQREFLHEKLIGLRIKNQESLADLIPKDQARERAYNALSIFGDIVQTTLETASKEVSIEFSIERAKVEQILTQNYMTILEKVVAESVKIVEWADEDSTKSIMRTRIAQKYNEIEKEELSCSELIKSHKKHEPLSMSQFNNIFTGDD
jgi:hypothetical protein